MKATPLQQVYLDAAEMVGSGLCDFSCSAVDHRAPPPDNGISLFTPERELYERTMGNIPEDTELYGDEPFLAIDQFEGEGRTRDEARDLRVLALCFMAAACEDLE